MLHYDNPAPFPRVMLHEGLYGTGAPLIVGGAVQAGFVAKIAKFSHWCVTPPTSDAAYALWASAIAAVRAARPSIKILLHVQGPVHWLATEAWPADIMAAVDGNYLRRISDGTAWTSDSGRYADLSIASVRNGILAVYYEMLDTGLYDGYMLDNGYADSTWRTALDPDVDLSKWGSPAAWSSAMATAKGQMYTALRSRYPTMIGIGNGGPRGSYTGGEQASGWWRENFPNQNGGTWASNMTASDGMLNDPAYYVDEYDPGRHHFSTIATVGTTGGALDQITARYGLASSCLGEGIFVWGPGDFDPADNYIDWTFNELGLDRSTGAPTSSYGDWLGRPVDDAYLEGGLWKRQFVFGQVSVNPAGSGTLSVWT